MTIHSDHPFLEPEDVRRSARRLRGRLPAPVTVWTAVHDRARAGLTVSSLVVADGEPAQVLGLIDDESELWTALCGSRRCALTLLAPADTAVADVMAGLAPSPGGAFRTGGWLDTDWGPVLADRSWVGARLAGDPRTVGWSLLVALEVEQVRLLAGEDAGALAYQRGRYLPVPSR